MGKYSAVDLTRVTATSVDGVIAWTTAANDEGEIVELIMTGSGSDAATDVMHRATLDFSDGGTEAVGSAHTPSKFNQNSAASGITVEVTITTEQATIITPPAVQFSFNARGGMRWAVPRTEGVMIRFDNTNEDISFRIISSATGCT